MPAAPVFQRTVESLRITAISRAHDPRVPRPRRPAPARRPQRHRQDFPAQHVLRSARPRARGPVRVRDSSPPTNSETWCRHLRHQGGELLQNDRLRSRSTAPSRPRAGCHFWS